MIVFISTAFKTWTRDYRRWCQRAKNSPQTTWTISGQLLFQTFLARLLPERLRGNERLLNVSLARQARWEAKKKLPNNWTVNGWVIDADSPKTEHPDNNVRLMKPAHQFQPNMCHLQGKKVVWNTDTCRRRIRLKSLKLHPHFPRLRLFLPPNENENHARREDRK